MKITCPYCGNLFDDGNKQCPHCLAPNDSHADAAAGPPNTIDELRAWYAERHLPPYETTRFFIGENVTMPRAFGIYREGERVVVYKNKDNGQRAVRYEGTDEGYAVSEFFSKLKDEILHQKQRNFHMSAQLNGDKVTMEAGENRFEAIPAAAAPKRRGLGCLSKILIALVILILLGIIFDRCGGSSEPYTQQGYYNYNGETYYFQENDQNDNSGWYSYNNGGWNIVQSLPDEFFSNSDDYYSSDYYSYDPYYSDFADSNYYEEPSWSPSSSAWDDSSSSSSWDDDSSSSWGSFWDDDSSSSSWDDSSWDSDDDWSWDSSDSWDSSSGSSDWDSDW